jgi:DNA-binding MarR family transcriptional regulator
MMSAAELLLSRTDLSPEGRVIAEVLCKLGGYVSFRIIARRTGLELGTIARVIRGFEASGLVQIRPSLHRDEQGARVITEGRA